MVILFKDALNEYAYAAQLAGLGWNIIPTRSGLLVRNEQIYVLLPSEYTYCCYLLRHVLHLKPYYNNNILFQHHRLVFLDTMKNYRFFWKKLCRK